jgi:hypothetical protein
MIRSALVLVSLVAVAHAGSVNGTVIFEGEPPENPAGCTKDKTEPVVVVTKGKLAGVVVRIKGLAAGAAPTSEVHIAKHGCELTPRLAAIHVGQKVKLDGDLKPSKDPATAQAGDVIELSSKTQPTLHGYITVEDSWHFAVTGEDGKFEIDDLEPGTYTLEAWHPTLGEKTLQIVIGKGKRGDVTARFSYTP